MLLADVFQRGLAFGEEMLKGPSYAGRLRIGILSTPAMGKTAHRWLCSLFRSLDVILDATLLSLRPIALGCLRHPGCGHFMRIHDIGELSLGCRAHELIMYGTCRAFFTSNNFSASQPDKAHCRFIFVHVPTSGTLIITVASDTTPIIFFSLCTNNTFSCFAFWQGTPSTSP